MTEGATMSTHISSVPIQNVRVDTNFESEGTRDVFESRVARKVDSVEEVAKVTTENCKKLFNL